MHAIALVDDNAPYRAQLAIMLEREGMRVEQFPSAAAFLAALPSLAVDLVLLDQIMPGLTGVEILPQLRARSAVPCIMLTACEDEAVRLHGLEGGADDYVGKETSSRELLARIRIALRRGAQAPASPKGTGRWEFSPEQRVLRRPDGTIVRLTTTEFDLLAILNERQGEVVPREECFRRLFRRTLQPGDRAVDTLVAKLRAKMEAGPDTPGRIYSVRNVGYVFLGFNPEGPRRITAAGERDA